MKKVLNWLYDYPNLKVYQFEEGFKFSIDSVLLAEFAEIKKKDNKIIDLCTGNAVIPILLYQKYRKDVYGVEIQKEIAELASDSVLYNKMEKHITILNDNVLNLKNYFPGNNFDVVLANPPYFKYHNEQFINDELVKGIARHEIKINLKELMAMANFLLNNKGKFYLVHIPERIEEIILYANEYGFHIKKMQFVTSKEGRKPILVLLCLVKKSNLGCIVMNEICIDGLDMYQNIFKK